MSEAAARASGPEVEKGAWSEIFGGGLGLYSMLVIGGVAMQATQMLVIAIIMPTIVADIGGADLLHLDGDALHDRRDRRRRIDRHGLGPARSAAQLYARRAGVRARHDVLRAGPGIGALIAARTVQGWAGGLVAGSGMALITSLYGARLRTRIIAVSQGTFTACHLSGPVVGGMFAAMNWWRGSFWVMVPFMLVFAGIAYARIPEGIGTSDGARGPASPAAAAATGGALRPGCAASPPPGRSRGCRCACC